MKKLEQVLDFLIPKRKTAMPLQELLDEFTLLLGIHRVFFIVEIPCFWARRKLFLKGLPQMRSDFLKEG